MNLSDFQILKEDVGHYHLAHPNGQKMSVAKALLSGPAKKAIEKMCSGGQVAKMAEGGAPPSSIALPDDTQQEPDIAAVPDSIVAPPAQSSGVSGSWEPEPAAPQAAAAPVDPLIQKGNETEALLNKEQGQAEALGKVQSGEAGQTYQAYKQFLDDRQKMKTQEDIINDNRQQNDKLMNDYLNKKIDPDHYLHNMGTGSKIAAGISMIFGGLGQGLIGGKNPGVEWLQNSINQDIEGQRNEQGKTMNLWRMNREVLGDDLKANLATQNQMLTGVQAKLAMAGGSAQSSLAKFRSQQMVNELEKEKIKNRRDLGLLSQGATGASGNGVSNADPAQLVQDMVPKELQPKVYDEIAAAQNTTNNSPAIIKAFDNAAKNIHVADFIPGIPNADQKSLHALLGPTFKDVEGTVRQAAMDNMNENVTPQFGDSSQTLKTKRDTLLHYLHSKSSAPIAKGNGIDLKRFASTTDNPVARLSPRDQAAVMWAKANPRDPNAQRILEANGL